MEWINIISDEYVEYLVRKEECNKYAQSLWNKYLYVFGDLMIENYRWKSACKYLQKSIAYCLDKKKRKEEIDYKKMEDSIQKEMEEDLKEWLYLCEQMDNIKSLEFVSDLQLLEIYNLFYQISKKLQTSEHVLYEKARKAYLENDIDTLYQINAKLSKSKNKDYYFKPSEVENLREEIEEIKNQKIKPYLIVLESVENIQKRNKELREDTRSYKYYHKHLKRKLLRTI